MLFKTTRVLKDKVFSTSISFVDFGERDSLGAIDNESRIKEQSLVDDFGAPKITLGKEFIGHVKVVDGKVQLADYTDGIAETCISFILANKETEVTTGFAASIAIDAKKEQAVLGKLTAEQVAEAKCLVFEQAITERLKAAIATLKENFTTFEEEELAEIAIPIPAGPIHTH